MYPLFRMTNGCKTPIIATTTYQLVYKKSQTTLTLCHNCSPNDGAYTAYELSHTLCKSCIQNIKLKLNRKRSFLLELLYLVLVWISIQTNNSLVYGIIICLMKMFRKRMFNYTGKVAVYYFTNKTDIRYYVIMAFLWQRMNISENRYVIRKVEEREVEEVIEKVSKLTI